jgi:hypothetical protein
MKNIIGTSVRLVLLATVALAWWLHPASLAAAVPVSVTYVQGNFGTPQTAQTTVKVTYTAAQVAGDLNVVVVGWNDSKAVVSAVTDSKGNTYARAVGPTVQSGYASQSIYYAKNIATAAAGTNSVTVTFASAATSADIRILEYSGADPNNPVDVTAASTGSSATSSSVAVTTTNATDLLVGANLVQGSTTGPGSGFTKRLMTTPDGDIAEDRMLTAAGSYSASAPVSPSGAWIMQMVAFRTPSGGTVPPAVSSVSPNSGSTAGGTAVTITGTNFAAGATVTFGGTATTNVIAVNSTTITATTPAGSAGAVTVTVTVSGQSGSLTSGFTYVTSLAGSPTVAGVSPNSGSTAGGTAVTITGTNFAAGATATFGGTAATKAVVVSGTQITATTPAGSAGAVTVTVTVGGQTGSLANAFTYASPTSPPTVSGVSPNSGSTAGATAVTITGTNFATGATVTFGGAAATNVVVVSGTQITATTPAGSAGAVTVTVTVGGQTGSLANAFTYASPTSPPTVSGVSPNSGSTGGGTAVTIAGTNFAAGAAVTFGGTAATNVAVVSGTEITAMTPAGSAEAVTVTVTNPGAQSGSLANGFTYVVVATTAITYVQGNFGTPQTAESTVKVAYTVAQVAGDLNVVVVGWNDSTAVVSAVTDSSGNTYTRAVGPTVQSGYASQSIYYAKNIASAAAGTNSVTVTFASAATNPDIRIIEYKGADPSNPVDVTAASSGNSASSSSGSATTTNSTDLIFGANLVQTSTTGAGSGFTGRLMTTPDGDIAEDEMVTATGSYSATAPASPSGEWIMQMVAFRTPTGVTTPPTVSSVSPNSGSTAGGTAVTITGTNFAAGAAVTLGGTAATNVAVVSGTQITATTPAGSAGAVTVTVTVSGQSGSLASGFTYTSSGTPSLTSISVTPANPTILNGASQQFTATGKYSDGSTQNLTASVSWSSLDQNVATIAAGGLATAAGTGTSTIEAASSSISGSTTLTATSSSSAAPELVQHVSGSNSRNNSFSNPYCYYLWLPGYTTAGNAVVVGFTLGGTAAATVTDDMNDAFKMVANYYDSTDTQSIAIAAAFNVAPGARKISVCFAGSPGGYVQSMATEFSNVTGVDVSSAGVRGSGTSLTAGSVTPSASGELAYQIGYAMTTNQNQSSFTAGSQASAAWGLLSADLMDGLAAQYGVYNSTSAIDPTMTMGKGGTWISAAVLLNTGSAGGVPSGMRIVHLDHENIPTHTSSGGSGNPFPSPLTLELPCSGNLEVALMGGGNPPNLITGMTDSNGNSWEQAGQNVTYGDTDLQTFYAANASCSSTLAVTVQWDSTDGDQTIMFYDVAGAAASPLDTTASATGSQSTAGNLTALSITPSTSSTEFIFAMMPVDYNTVTGLVNGFNDADMFSGEALSGPEPVDENNGWGHFVVSSTNAVPITWTFLSNSLAAGSWSSMASAFK